MAETYGPKPGCFSDSHIPRSLWLFSGWRVQHGQLRLNRLKHFNHQLSLQCHRRPGRQPMDWSGRFPDMAQTPLLPQPP